MDEAGILVAVIPKINQLAVGQENKIGIQRLGGGPRLIFGGVRVNGLAFGFDDGEVATATGEESVISAKDFIPGGTNGTILKLTGKTLDRNLRPDLRLVSRIPSSFSQQIINDDPGIGF